MVAKMEGWEQEEQESERGQKEDNRKDRRAGTFSTESSQIYSSQNIEKLLNYM